MSEPKFKVDDKVEVFVLENVCRKSERSDSDYSYYTLPKPCIGYIKRVEKQKDEFGNLYAIEFDETEITGLTAILNKLKKEEDDWSLDSGLHSCRGSTKSDSGRWILEDAMRIYSEMLPVKTGRTRVNMLRMLLTSTRKQEEITYINKVSE